MIVPLLITFGVLVGGWSFLTVLGNERQRKVQDFELTHPKKSPNAQTESAAQPSQSAH